MTQRDCSMCELEQVLRTRSAQVRRELQKMNPIADPNYNSLFQVLVDVDQDLRKTREPADA